MPHCVMHATQAFIDRFDMKELLLGAKKAMVSSQLFSEDAIKLRVLLSQEYNIADAYDDCLYVQIRLLAGRSAAQKNALSDVVYAYLVQTIHDERISIGVEIVDMEKESYRKN